MKERRKMDFKNLAYPFEDVGDAPFNVVRILNECYNDYSNGNLGDVSIITGDILLNILIENLGINSGTVDWGCCDIFDPGDPGGGGLPDPGDPGGGGLPDPGDPGDADGISSGSINGNGTLLSDAVSTGPAIIGLSDTSSIAAQSLIFWAGVMMMLFGIRIIAKEKMPALNGYKVK